MESVATTKKHKSLKKGFYPNQGPNRRQRREGLSVRITNNRKMTEARRQRVQMIKVSIYFYKGRWVKYTEIPHKLLLDPEKLNTLPRAIALKTVIHFEGAFNRKN